jgi:hypothetical protein
MAPERSELGQSLVGRDAELSALSAALARAASGRGRIVAITGEPGIGKTRLVDEFVRTAGLPPSRVLRGRCPEQAGVPSYWPWTRVLRALAGSVGIEAVREALGDDLPAIGPLLPALGVRGAPGSAPSDAAARYELFAAATALLCRVAASEPLLVVLEDVHWADEASLALLEFVAQEIDGARLLLLLTLRDRERSARPRALGEAVRHGQRIALRGLDRRAVARLVAEYAGERAASDLAERLFEVTAGNPFFLVEVLRALQQEGQLDAPLPAREPLLLPDTVRDSIRRELLATAAVAGDDVDVRLLAKVLGVEPATALERLNAAVGRGFVVERGEGRFRLAHALVRETIYGDLLPAARVHLHARVGETLEAMHGGDDTPPCGALARHFLNAGPLGTSVKAVRYAKRAARQAMALFAFHDALAFYEQALAAIGSDPAEREERQTLRLDAAGAAIRAGLDQRGCELLLLAARDARASRPRRTAASGAQLLPAAAESLRARPADAPAARGGARRVRRRRLARPRDSAVAALHLARGRRQPRQRRHERGCRGDGPPPRRPGGALHRAARAPPDRRRTGQHASAARARRGGGRAHRARCDAQRAPRARRARALPARARRRPRGEGRDRAHGPRRGPAEGARPPVAGAAAARDGRAARGPLR